ncbi:hypothetical protein AAW51_5360 [Caldimonas brevitalea]|uniref:Uncharacterized protein n=1 Tax=Caldimonas brevitalea TaxID=413882 RepID=A0A0G3BXF6_9BURK|nr:hypothetical protein AAW51_5360 [Caldimonas brevitalea]
MLSGCASSPGGAPAEAAPAEPVRTVQQVALLPVLSPAGLYSGNRNLALPHWVTAIDNRLKTQSFSSAMEQTRQAMGPEMRRVLVNELTAQGYEVEMLDAPAPPADDPSAIDYTTLPASKPILHVWFEYVGMYSSAFSANYLPQVNVSAYLVDAKAVDDPLLHETYYYGADARGEQYWSLPSAPKYRYATFDAMIANREEVAEGFQVGVGAVAQRIARELRSRFGDPKAATTASR